MVSMPQIPLAKKSVRLWKRRNVSFERRLLHSILYTGFPGVILGEVLLWANHYSLDHKIEGTVLVLGLWAGISYSVRNKVIHSVRVVSNVIAALQEEDFSFRATRAVRGDALGDLAIEINNLARALESERLGSIETASLLRKVMDGADAAIFAFTPERRVCLLNRMGAIFLDRHEDQILNRTADELGIQDLIDGPRSGTISRGWSGTQKKWLVRRASFRQNGISHQLILLSEASEILRAEERVAWQRLIRVLGHEINNSLAPIKSIARTLSQIPVKTKLPEDDAENFRLGLEVIGGRADSLTRFLQNYTRLGTLPTPMRRVQEISKLMTGVAALEVRLPVKVKQGNAVNIIVDGAQCEQALINLIRNAVDAVLSAPQHSVGPDAVTLSWKTSAKDLEVRIEDEGIGLLETDNLFVPFYTTKEKGSGIGLVLTRQIIEAHGGHLVIRNRSDRPGCEVTITIPNCVVGNQKTAVLPM